VDKGDYPSKEDRMDYPGGPVASLVGAVGFQLKSFLTRSYASESS
jgi:hypothetical protein